MVEQLVTLADIIGVNSTAALAFEDALDATDSLAALQTKPHILLAKIFTNNGQALAHYVAAGKEEQSELVDLYLQKSQLWDDLLGSTSMYETQRLFRNQYLFVLNPIALDGQKTGSVLLISASNNGGRPCSCMFFPIIGPTCSLGVSGTLG